MLLSFFDYLEAELDSRDFFRPPEKKPLMIRNLRNMFHRMGMTEQDVRTFRGLVVRLVEGQRITKTRPRKGPHQTPKGTRPGAPAVVPGTDTDTDLDPSAAT
jgi:tRNA/rRNA methyltransferase